MNNTMVLDHHGLFIYIDLAYHGFYHDVNNIHHSAIYREWHQYFIHHDEFLLEDPRYLGEEMFIMKRMGRQELPPDVDHGVIQVYNKMHVGFKVQVEWGISGLK
jgi:hypothetical protein